MTDPVLDALNPAQREAVTTLEGPVLVNAGAGSGKTRVITHRIAYLVQRAHVPPWRIFAATFTNKAAEEMKRRLAALLPGLEAARLSIGTFHSLCVSILRREAAAVGLSPRFTILDESDQLALLKDCMRALESSLGGAQPREALARIGEAKTEMLAPADVRRDRLAAWGEPMVEVFERYEAALQANNAVDFDDLLLKTVRLFETEPSVLSQYRDRWRYVLVDEYQDINRVQFELIRLLAGDEGNLCVVGDEDQSIYSWRGAAIENILEFPERFPRPRIIRLEQNYRSTGVILEAANHVISRNRSRLGKNLWSSRGAGEPITLVVGADEREEAALVVETLRWLRSVCGLRYRDMAIFYRINALSRLFEDMLRRARIPYRVVGGPRFYDRAEIKDLIAYLRLIVNPHEGLSLARVINRPRRGIGEKSFSQIVSGADERGLLIWDYLPEALKAGILPKKAAAGLTDLIEAIGRWRGLAGDERPGGLLRRVLDETGYEAALGDPRSLEGLTRRENVAELERAVEQFEQERPGATLEEYLEKVALMSPVDELNEDEDGVSLMTLHCAKGLEFPAVFLTGLEEGIFPSPRAVEEGHLEEERRLFYVGVTRARDRLFLSRADSRTLYGRVQYNPPSLLLHEIPAHLTQELAEARQARAGRAMASPRSSLLPEAGTAAALAEPVDALEDPAAEDSGRLFPPGARVRHARLGAGEVVAVRVEGARRKLAVRFDAGMEIEILADYGGLEPIGEMPF